MEQEKCLKIHSIGTIKKLLTLQCVRLQFTYLVSQICKERAKKMDSSQPRMMRNQMSCLDVLVHRGGVYEQNAEIVSFRVN